MDYLSILYWWVLGSFQFFIIANYIAMNIIVWMLSLQICVSIPIEKISKSRIARSWVLQVRQYWIDSARFPSKIVLIYISRWWWSENSLLTNTVCYEC